MDAVTAAQSAAYRLRKRRHSFIKSRMPPTVIPRPEPTSNDHRTKPYQQNVIHRPEPTTNDHRTKPHQQNVIPRAEPTSNDHRTKPRQQNEARLPQSSAEVVPEKPTRQYEEMERYWDKICNFEDTVANTDDSSSHINIISTNAARSETKEPGTHGKRKREAPSESPAVDLPDENHHDWKRRKLEIGTERPKIPPSSLRKEWRQDGADTVRPSKSPADSGTDVVLASSDQEASKEALGVINTSQPSVEVEEEEDHFVSFERSARISERSAMNKSRIRSQSREFTKHEKPIGPSKEFQKFLATRRQRKALLLKGENMWDEEDASFMQSGKKFAEPPAGLGEEVVAKRLLTVRDAALLNTDHSTDSPGRRFEYEKADEEVARV